MKVFAKSSCSIPGCGKQVRGKGYCVGHYRRFRIYGDPLAGRTSPGELLRWVHEVAILYTGVECLTWPYGTDGAGYGLLKVDGKYVVASRYVCELVHGTPPTPEHEASHSCGKGHLACISPIHLDWKTRTGNQADRLEHGTHSRGERSGKAKITEAEARYIIAMKGIVSQRKLANRFGVSREAVSCIHRSISWAWLSIETKEMAL